MIRTMRFTLIELLVVIAIISILITLLLPALKRIKATGKTLTCMSNQRQTNTAVLNYANDYDSFACPPTKEKAGYWWVYPHWMVAVHGGGLKTTKDLKGYWGCPELSIQSVNGDLTRTPGGRNWKSADGRFAIYFNCSILYKGGDFLRYTVRMHDINNPGKVLMMSDGLYEGIASYWGSRPICYRHYSKIHRDGYTTAGLTQGGVGKANIGFFDGHVETLTVQEAYNRKTDGSLVLNIESDNNKLVNRPINL